MITYFGYLRKRPVGVNWSICQLCCLTATLLLGCRPVVEESSLVNSLNRETLSLEDLFPKDRLLQVDIELPRSSWNRIRHQARPISASLNYKRQYQVLESPYTYVEAKVTIGGVEFPRVGIRKKGFIGSVSSSRPSLKIKLDLFDETEEIDGLSTLTFNNNKQDVSLCSQFIGYSLFNAAGSPAPRCALARVTVNGKNMGVYSHVESVKKHLFEREFGNKDGTLYEGTIVDFYQDWEGGFERKFGDDEAGRDHIVKVIHALGGGEGNPFFGEGAVGRAWVPASDQHDGEWFKPDFDDSQWRMGQNGAGYEREQGYEKFIGDGFDFEDQMYNKSTSLYIRFPFEIIDLDSIRSTRKLLLRVRCDDGFVAYINGEEVARSNAPSKTGWNSKARKSTQDWQSLNLVTHDITSHRNRFKYGRNVLAIHAMNHSKSSSDLLMTAELQVNDFDFENEIWNLIDEESFYTYWAMEGLLSFWDGYSGNRNNFFIYLNPGTSKFHFLPWGADSMFEKYSPLGVDRRSPRSVRTIGLLTHQLYQVPEVRKKYATRMKQLLSEHWHEDKLLAETQRIQDLVEPHLSSDQRGWFFDRKVDFESIRHFIRHRRADVEKEINGEDMPIWDVAPSPPPLRGR